MKQIDERDLMFSRINYKKGQENYKDYYTRNPDKKEIDDYLRTLPGLSNEKSSLFHKFGSNLIDSTFNLISDINHLAEGKKNTKIISLDKNIATKQIKNLGLYFGARSIGITKLSKEILYSHRGRNEKIYGEKIELNHKNLIVFSIEMDKKFINRAPFSEQTIEVAQAYLKAEIIALQIAYYIRQLGYEARAHIDGNYLVYLPLAAQKAGLGEFGNINIIVTKDYGPRIRFAAISTNLPLNYDLPIDFGLKNLCSICNKCVTNCIGRAFSKDGFKQEKCFEIWSKIGTDCGICMNSCPLSQPLSDELRKDITSTNYISKDLAKEIIKYSNDNYNKRNFNSNELNLLSEINY